MKQFGVWRWVWYLLPIVLFVAVLLSVEDLRSFFFALVLRLFWFLKKHIVLILTGFFLVKGKFILSLFLKKLALISATGLGKRYVIERVISKNIKRHFLDPISDDLKRLAEYLKIRFKAFPLTNRLIALFTFIGSLGIVGKLMGGLLVLKVLIARFWSLLLSIVLKVGTGVAYFFTDIFWGSWVAPLIEVLLFTWLLEWLEKIPFLKRFFAAIYAFFLAFFEELEEILERYFHLPIRRLLGGLAMRIKKGIYRIIGYERVNAYRSLQQIRALHPNTVARLREKRRSYLAKKRARPISLYQRRKEAKQKRKNSKKDPIDDHRDYLGGQSGSYPRRRYGRLRQSRMSPLHRRVSGSRV